MINILNFNLLHETDQYHSVFKLKEANQEFELVDDLEIHYLELKKFVEVNDYDQLSTLDQWLLFIRDTSDDKKQELIDHIKKRNEVINMAGEILNRVSQDEEARAIYQQRRKWYLDKVSSEKYLLHEGEEKGRKAEKIEMAQELIRKGMDSDFIQEVTKLPKEEVESIKREKRN